MFPKIIWLVVSTHLKNISQMGNLPQIVVKIKKMKPPPSYGYPQIINFNRVFHEINHPFWGTATLFLETPKKKQMKDHERIDLQVPGQKL